MSSPLAYADLQTRKNQLIRKALEGSFFFSPFSADPIVTLTTGEDAGLVELPTGWRDGGWLTTDGIDLAEAVTTSDVDSWGSPEPTRSDITKETTTGKIVFQETNAGTIAFYTGIGVDTLEPDPTTGELSIEKPLIPSSLEYRGLALAVDQSEAGEIYIGRFLPRLKVTDKDDQKMSNAGDPLNWGITVTAYADATLGYSSRYIFGGPGWKALLDDMGFGDES